MSRFVTKTHYLGLALLAGVLLLNAPLLNAAGKKTLTGTVSDVMCGAKHKMGDVSAAECTNKCVGMNSKYALVVGKTVYELEGKADDLKALAGQKVKLTGTVDGKKIQVESVSKA
ncbi:MAG: hypothetical protein HYX72_14295 [Acidobacteria bacterium]|nr:hypothetical protein [Acidobacteriota bacterium]